MGLKVEGLSTTVRDLKRLGVEVNDMKNVFESIGETVAMDARRSAPIKTGKLRRGIKASRTQNRSKIRSIVFYGPFLHFGTKYIKANPYMFEALDKNEPYILKALTLEVEKLVRRLG